MDQEEETSSKQHKVGIVTRHSTDARINQNTSIRKDKRAQKFDRKIRTDSDDVLSKIDDEFLKVYIQNRVPIEQIVSKTLEGVFSNDGQSAIQGLSQLWVLCQNTQFHCHDSVIRLLPAERLLQRFVYLMRNSSDVHLPRIAMIVSLIMQNPKEKVNAWNEAVLKTELVRGIIHFIRAPERCSKKTQTCLLHALLHFLLSCGSSALKEVLPPLRDTMELLMNVKHCQGYVAWYLHIMFQKKRPQPYDRKEFCTEALWNFAVQNVCTASIAELLPLPQGQGQGQNKEARYLLLDSLECVYQNAFRGPQSIFLSACKKIGAKQLLEFVQSSLNCTGGGATEEFSDAISIARTSSDILANWCQMDLEFCRGFMDNCFEVVKALLRATNQKQGPHYDLGISSVHNNLVSITADYSETEGCSKLLLQQGFFWEYVCNLEKLKYNDKTDACHQLFTIRNTLADVVNLDAVYNDINIFRRVFPDPAYFIEAMTRQYNSTHRNYQGVVQSLICEVLSTCLEWSDHFGQTKLFRGPMKRDEDAGLYYVLERVELEEIDDDVRESAAATLAYYRSEK